MTGHFVDLGQGQGVGGSKPIFRQGSEAAVAIHLAEETADYRQSLVCSLSVRHGPEMDSRVIGAHPATCRQIRGASDKPTVGVLLGGSCFPGKFPWNFVG